MGSDVVANASSYKAAPVPGSVHSMNHIVFRRSSDAEGREIDADLGCISGRIIQLQLPTHLEDISSTRIRENIDLGRDISTLIDPVVQDFIYRNSLYLREPQYKRILRAGDLEFSHISQPDRHLWEELTEVPLQGREQPPEIDPRVGLCILRDAGSRPRVLGFLTLRTVNSGGLYEALGDTELADYVRKHTAGRVQLLTGLYTARGSSGSYDVGQLLMTEALSRSLGEDCSYAVWHATASEETLDLLERQGFVPAELPSAKPLLLVDMRSPSVLLQNIPTTLKEPFLRPYRAGGGPRRPLPDAAGSHRPVSGFSDPVPERGGHLPPSGAEDCGPERRPGGAHSAPGTGSQDVRTLRQDPAGQCYPQHRHQDHPHRQGLCQGPHLLRH